MNHRLVLPAVLAVVACTLACGESSSTEPASTPGLSVTSSRTIADTVTAQSTAPVSVTLRGADGQPVQGATVRFETITLNESVRKGAWAVLCANSAAGCGTVGTSAVTGTTSLSATTDAEGMASAYVRLGTFAGSTFLRISAPAQNAVDSIALNIGPGAVARINFTARDTSIAVGGRSTTEAFSADRFFNARNDAVAVTSTCGATGDLDPATKLVTARTFGTCWVRASAGSIVDSARIRVVPAGRLVAWSTVPLLELVNTDGTAPRPLFGGGGLRSDLGVFPRFSPSRSTVLLHTTQSAAGLPQMIVRGDTSAASPSVLASSIEAPAYARELADGSILFVGRTAAGASTYAVWRVTSGGTPTQVRAIPNYAATYGSADISPDGSRLAYVAGVTGGSNMIRMLDLSTGVVSDFNVVGEAPRWSAAGDQIGFLPGVSANNVRGPVSAVRISDGTSRVISTQTVLPGYAWSPDGLYIVGGTDAGPIIIRISDGVTVPLRILSSPFAREFDWR